MKVVIRTVLCILILVVIWEWEKVEVYKTGYAIETLKDRKKHVEQEQRALQVELAKLTSPERIEQVAVTKLGLSRPRYDQVVVVGEVPKALPDPERSTLIRVAHTE
jgi:cell division protein FtsL